MFIDLIINGFMKQIIYDNYLNKETIDLIIIDKHTIELPYGWVIFYNSKKYIETGKSKYQIGGNAPYIFNKNNGSIKCTGTARAIYYYILEYELLELKIDCVFQFFVERVFNSKEKIIFYQVLRNRFNQGNLEVHKYYNQPFTIESMEEFMELEEVELLLKERGLKIELKRIE